MNPRDCADSHVPKFVWLLSVLPRFARCLQPLGRVSPGELYPAAPGLILRETSRHRLAMFRIVLRPEEIALLYAIREGGCSDKVPGAVLLNLVALRMLKCDEDGNPTLTDLGEAALERMSGKIH